MCNGEAATNESKTLIGVLASHDSPAKHLELAQTLETLRKDPKLDLEQFHFVFTGGTYRRLVIGEGCPSAGKDSSKGLRENDARFKDLRKHLFDHSTALPERQEGGLVLLANLVIHHQCELLWLFLSPETPHWVNCQNMALLRLSDICFAKKYMNAASVLRWAAEEAERDEDRNRQQVNPLVVQLGSPEGQGRYGDNQYRSEIPKPDPRKRETDCFVDCSHTALGEKDCRVWPRSRRDDDRAWRIAVPKREEQEEQREQKEQKGRDWEDHGSLSIALISHDAMKPRMVDFATQYERELMRFRRILTTGTTGTEIQKRCHDLREAKKIELCQSGPYGGDLEIAAEVLCDRCQVVVFFVDPLHPHPHSEDIRVVFSVCMGQPPSNEVLMLSNELQAKEWFDTIRFRSCRQRKEGDRGALDQTRSHAPSSQCPPPWSS